MFLVHALLTMGAKEKGNAAISHHALSYKTCDCAKGCIVEGTQAVVRETDEAGRLAHRRAARNLPVPLLRPLGLRCCSLLELLRWRRLEAPA